jgi:hypothetical protein
MFSICLQYFFEERFRGNDVLSIESRDRLIEGSLRISHFENDTNFRRACSPTCETKFSAVSRRDLIDPPKHKIPHHTAHRRSCLAKPMISSVYIPVRLVTISGQIQRIWSSRCRWQNRKTLSKGQVDAVLGYLDKTRNLIRNRVAFPAFGPGWSRSLFAPCKTFTANLEVHRHH